ncbi:MerR family transcriptional regulator [Frigidibacter sp. RF13]|uniref:MerR family transcriptional regulator n=1 Tax=Frigidibacter sp. RF13 TaxID=2997340 RepID=UPI00226EE1A5|nr:MerR family transcriptional regulator [Frigidibacter sp. RF13]MCY1125282.1 MerR family transcriptional regulator [Frigidibacter sp. RF13]
MSKSAEAFRTISEVAEHLDTPAHVLRFWESRFSQIKPVKRAGGRRYYRPADVALLSGIKKLLHEDGLTIRGVQKLLREQGVRQIAGLADGTTELEATPATPRRLDRIDRDLPNEEPASPDEMLASDDRSTAEAGLRADPVSPARPSVTEAAESRADLQRAREAERARAAPLAPESHFDPARAEGDWIPAAAMLRAMTQHHAQSRREELRTVYLKLSALYERRLARRS